MRTSILAAVAGGFASASANLKVESIARISSPKSLERGHCDSLDPCKYAPPGSYVPDPKTFFLPNVHNKRDNHWGLCKHDAYCNDHEIFSKVKFDFKGDSLVFDFNIPGAHYEDVEIKIQREAPPTELSPKFNYHNGHCRPNHHGGLSCSLPYHALNCNGWQEMCPAKDEGGWVFYVQIKLVINLYGRRITLYNQAIEKSTRTCWFSLSYCCTKCPDCHHPPAPALCPKPCHDHKYPEPHKCNHGCHKPYPQHHAKPYPHHEHKPYPHHYPKPCPHKHHPQPCHKCHQPHWPRVEERAYVAPAGPAAQGPAAHGPAAQGPAAQGPAAHGPAAQGPAAQGPAAQGPAAQGPAAQGPAAQGPAAHGPAAQGPAAHGPASQGPAAHGTVVHGPGSKRPTSKGPAVKRPGSHNSHSWPHSHQHKGTHHHHGQEIDVACQSAQVVIFGQGAHSHRLKELGHYPGHEECKHREGHYHTYVKHDLEVTVAGALELNNNAFGSFVVEFDKYNKDTEIIIKIDVWNALYYVVEAAVFIDCKEGIEHGWGGHHGAHICRPETFPFWYVDEKGIGNYDFHIKDEFKCKGDYVFALWVKVCIADERSDCHYHHVPLSA